MNTSPMVFPRQKSKGLNIALWIVQSLLAAMFLMSGMLKLLKPEMAKDISVGLMYFIGISEVAGAVGLVLPSILRIKPVLTPIAAIGILIIMILATITHISKGEISHTTVPVILGALAVFVAWGRYYKMPIQPAR